MDYAKRTELVSLIRAKRNMVASDYAKETGLSTRAVNSFLLNDDEGQRLVDDGFVGVVFGESLPKWAQNPDGNKKSSVQNVNRVTPKEKALVVLPAPPTKSGMEAYDQMAAEVYDYDRGLTIAKSAKLKNELLVGRAKAQEYQSMMMAFMRERDEANRETIAAHKETIAAQKVAMAAQEQSSISGSSNGIDHNPLPNLPRR